MKNILQRTTLFVLTTLLGLLFIGSAYFKFISVDLFELNLVDTGFVGWSLAPWMARLIIGFELFLGILIILNFRLHGFTLWLSFGLLIFFTAYLFIVLLTLGNQENCNCFGSFITLSPLQSILKNLFLLTVTFILYRYHKGLEWEHPRWILSVAFVVTFVIPFTVDPLSLSHDTRIFRDPQLKKLDLSQLYSGSTFIKPAAELRKGKQIVAFLSMTCPSCILTAYKYHLIRIKNPAVPVSFILTGKISDLQRFLSRTKAYNIPHSLLLKQDFVKVAGTEVPVIVYLNDGIIVKRIHYLQIDQADIERWLNN